jgi:hypothetical protein
MSKFDSSQETYEEYLRRTCDEFVNLHEEYLRRNRLDHKLKKRVKSNDQEKKVISFQEAKKIKAT